MTKQYSLLSNRSIGRSPYQSKPIDVFAFLGQFESAEWFFEQQRQLERQYSDQQDRQDGQEQSRDYEYYDLPAFTTPSYTTTTTTTTTTAKTTATTRKVKLIC